MNLMELLTLWGNGGLKGLLTSKKANASAIGAILAMFSGKLLTASGIQFDPSLIQASPWVMVGLAVAYLIAQGLSDHGKERALANMKETAISYMANSHLSSDQAVAILKLAGFSDEEARAIVPVAAPFEQKAEELIRAEVAKYMSDGRTVSVGGPVVAVPAPAPAPALVQPYYPQAGDHVVSKDGSISGTVASSTQDTITFDRSTLRGISLDSTKLPVFLSDGYNWVKVVNP